MMNYENMLKKQAEQTLANVFSYIIDHGELIPEEKCLEMCGEFHRDKKYNTLINISKETKEAEKRRLIWEHKNLREGYPHEK